MFFTLAEQFRKAKLFKGTFLQSSLKPVKCSHHLFRVFVSATKYLSPKCFQQKRKFCFVLKRFVFILIFREINVFFAVAVILICNELQRIFFLLFFWIRERTLHLNAITLVKGLLIFCLIKMLKSIIFKVIKVNIQLNAHVTLRYSGKGLSFQLKTHLLE